MKTTAVTKVTMLAMDKGVNVGGDENDSLGLWVMNRAVRTSRRRSSGKFQRGTSVNLP